MMRIFGAWHENDATLALFQNLRQLEDESGPFDEVGLATLTEERIQHQHFRSLDQLSQWMQEPPLFGQLGLAYTCSNRAKEKASGYSTQLCANQQTAIVFQGGLDSVRLCEGRNWDAAWNQQTDGEKAFSLLTHYLGIDGIDATDAMNLTLTRLKGYFTIMGLFAKEELLMVVSRGCPISIGLDEETTCFGSDSRAMTGLFQRVIHLEGGNLMALCSVTGKIAHWAGDLFNG